jgi:hypothetical protein
MHQDQAAAFYVPVNYNLEILPEEFRWPAAYVLNLVHWRWCCWRADAKGYVRLKYAYLVKVIPRKVWRELRAYLEGLKRIPDSDPPGKYYPKVIDCPGREQEGTCYGYRLTPDYRKTHRIVCTDNTLNRRIQKLYAREAGNPAPVHGWLRGKFDFLDFDLGEARLIIDKLKPRRNSRGPKLDVAAYRQLLSEYCQRIADREFWFNSDKFGRVHTPVTALKRELRCCLSVKGQPVVGIDLANSQPLLLGVFGRQYFAHRMARSRFLNKSFDGRQSPYCPQEVRAAAQRTNHELPADLTEYIRVCEEGRFYDCMMSEDDRIKDKARIKKRWYRVLFGRNKARDPRFQNQLRIRFKKRFPAVATVLRALKKKNYRHSAHVLQNYESTLFICLICGRIRKERPGTMLFTIHDSLLTTPDALEYVRRVVLDEFRKLGIRPTLHEERYDEHA